MKKFLAMLLAAMMLLACVPAMAEEVENPYEEYGITIARGADGKVIDLGGMEIIIADWWSTDWHDQEPDTASAEATYEYRTWLEETYNFTIKTLNATTWNDSPADFTNIATTGTDKNYVWVLRNGVWLEPMKKGLFYDLSTLDCLNFEDEKWNDMIHDMTTVDGKIYAMRPMKAEPRKGVFFNKRLLNDAGVDPESLYDMQRDGTWTWEAFEELCSKLARDTDNDGIVDKYAMMSFSSHLIPAALISNGAGFVMVDENGKYYNAAETDAFLEAANWAMDMVSKYEMKAPEGAEWNYYESAFINGEVALQVHEDYFAGNLKNMEDDYGFVMFPKGPKADTYLFAPQDNVYVIPANYDADRAWKIAFAYNLFTNPTPGYGETDDWKSDAYAKYRDERAVDETLEMMRDTAHQFVWYSDLVTGYDLGNDYIWGVYAGNETPAQRAETMRGTWQSYIDTANGVAPTTTEAPTVEEPAAPAAE